MGVVRNIDKILSFKFYRTRVGFENKIYDDLAKKSKADHYFKVFGKYDLMQISNVAAIEDMTASNRPPEVFELVSLPAISYEPLDASNFETPAAGFILLKVNPLILDELSSGCFLNFLQEFIAELRIKEPNAHIVPFLGLGYYEAILWLPSDNVEDIFNLLKIIRNTTKDNIKVFVDTTTFPLVSYPLVIKAENWDLLKGSVRVIVKSRCDPPAEANIPATVKLRLYDAIGEDDIVYLSEQLEPFSEFISKLLKYRQDFASGEILTNTSTQFLSQKFIEPKVENRTELQEQESGKVVTDKKTIYPFEREAEELQTLITKLGDRGDPDDYVLSLVQQFLSFIQCNKNKLLAAKEFTNIIGTLSFIHDKMQEYQSAIGKKCAIEVNNVEADLLFLLEALQNALVQKTPGGEFSQAVSISVPVPHTHMAPAVLRSISTIPEFLFSQIIKASKVEVGNKSCDSEKSWDGFVYLDIKEGYRLVNDREVISVPHRHILNPCNWITLSHEVGHAYFSRLNFLSKEDDFLGTVGRAVKSGPERVTFRKYIEETTWEIFAHWCDYRFFFDSDLPLYFKSIWRTWLEIPRVYEIKTDYWFRCLMIYLAGNFKDFEEKTEGIYKKNSGDQKKTAEGYHQYFMGVLDELEEYLSKEVFMTSSQKASLKLKADEKDRVCQNAVMLSCLISILEKKYFSSELKTLVNQPYKNLTKHVDMLLSGQVILDDIENPFLLLREVMKTALVSDPELSLMADPKVVFSIIMSLSGNTDVESTIQ